MFTKFFDDDPKKIAESENKIICTNFHCKLIGRCKMTARPA